ncbi:AAA family ATPase [Methylomonas sp. ZR1]|uniref:AAA family ATPase n=1 Tax=Methylomonas sp. ZR1 TaxID=1797072 RepID=UPI001491714B|nr:AAA family ATPase [Methylomonas sp. ZR1]NOV28561.1 AAA family ATPase [Methylomonas sp. ZR1]
MKINKLILNNFRCFEKYEIDFSDRFTLLIGDNGSGKTAILDALAIAVSKFLESPGIHELLNQNQPKITNDDIRDVRLIMGQNPIKEKTTFSKLISVEGCINNKNMTWSASKGGLLSNTTPDLLNAFPRNITDPLTLLPLISYQNTDRLWGKKEHFNVDTASPTTRLFGYLNCLSNTSNIKLIFSWFKTQEFAALQKNERRHVLEAVRNAIVEMIPGAKHAWWDVDWDEILIETEIQGKAQTIPFHLLSDGYRNMIGMVADIAYRMATLNPQLEADVIKQTEGIVLIDEIDLHLHPKWQREVVGRLLNTFPKVQFVASSHSPFIIQSLYGRDDCLLWDLEKAQPITIESESIEDIAEDQQHVEIPQKSKRYLDMMEAAEAYYRKLHEANNESDMEVMQLRSKLDELSIPFSDDPAFAAQLKFERDSVLASKDK